ncbi:hypothetical protein H5410_046096 [Solanum commersonii]|uniref:Uncharacterized protein n=1 Tax=Solanum commersonii TaxID=4109 RepID=A0A9J5XEN4_SOLCO|nr:hypothetical protein H5410_046096 [Solanum commersonii]
MMEKFFKWKRFKKFVMLLRSSKRDAVVVQNVSAYVDEVAKGFTVECCDDDEFVQDEDIVCDNVSSPHSESNSSKSSNNDFVETNQQNQENKLLNLYSSCCRMSTRLCLGSNVCGVKLLIKIQPLTTEIKNESAEDFVLLLKDWEQLCASYSLKYPSTSFVEILVENVNSAEDEVAKGFTIDCCDDDEFVEDEDIMLELLTVNQIQPYQATMMLWRSINITKKRISSISIPVVVECPLTCARVAMFRVLDLFLIAFEGEGATLYILLLVEKQYLSTPFVENVSYPDSELYSTISANGDVVEANEQNTLKKLLDLYSSFCRMSIRLCLGSDMFHVLIVNQIPPYLTTVMLWRSANEQNHEKKLLDLYSSCCRMSTRLFLGCNLCGFKLEWDQLCASYSLSKRNTRAHPMLKIPPYQATVMLWRQMNRSKKIRSRISILVIVECPLGCA